MPYRVVVYASGDAPPGQLFIAPYAAMAMGESFMRQGRDALVIFDDLSQHARTYRELSLPLRRPPGRESFPGDIF
jgi:F-type H+-transporting ATPase subunit alpha